MVCLHNLHVLMALIDARSVCNKPESFHDQLIDNDLDLLAVTETWTNSTNEGRISVSFHLEGFDIIISNWQLQGGGGPALIQRSSLIVTYAKIKLWSNHLNLSKLPSIGKLVP